MYFLIPNLIPDGASGVDHKSVPQLESITILGINPAIQFGLMLGTKLRGDYHIVKVLGTGGFAQTHIVVAKKTQA